MLRKLLIDQFKLEIHMEQEETQGYALVVAKNGPKLKPATGDYSGMRSNTLRITATNAPLSELAQALAHAAEGR